MPQKTSPYLIAILVFNIIPLIGVAYYNWSPFEMFWLFWMETLIISVFNAIRVLFSQGMHESGETFKLNFLQAGKYLLLKIIIFLFYSIFIILFIGFKSNKEGASLHTVTTIAFQNLLFNMALLLSIASNAFYLIKNFFANGAYRDTLPSDFPGLFDSRQIVIHVAVVLGAVGSSFLFEKSGNAHYSSIWIISIFCLVKCFFEWYPLRTGGSKNMTARTGL